MPCRRLLLSWAVLLCARPGHGCRWAVFASSTLEPRPSSAAAELFLHSEHSLAVQSYSEPFLPYLNRSSRWDPAQSVMRNHKCNRDGWGLGWAGAGSEAGDGQMLQVHRSAAPATTESVPSVELREFLAQARGRMAMGHIRAATEGANLELNTHPFLFADHGGGRIIWMHNGGISNIDAVRIQLLERLPPHIQEQITGSTDSELAGGIFVAELEAARHVGQEGAAALETAMRRMLALITEPDRHRDATYALLHLSRSAAEAPSLLGPFDESRCVPGLASSLNFAASDGHNVVATRFRSCDAEDPPTLYVAWSAPAGQHGGGAYHHHPGPTCSFSDDEDEMSSLPLPCLLAELAVGKLTASAGQIWVASEPLDRTNGARWATTGACGYNRQCAQQMCR